MTPNCSPSCFSAPNREWRNVINDHYAGAT